jgi:DNA-binding MarR family transcriptional regulator
MDPTPGNSLTSTILDDLPFVFVRASLAFRRFNELSLQAIGLKNLAPGLASVLHALEEMGPCTVNRLVERTHLPNGTLTGLLDTLEREGHIRRSRNPDDGRSRLIALTTGGKVLCSRLRERHLLVMNHLSGRMDESDLAQLTSLLEQLAACMQAFEPVVDVSSKPTMP